MNQNRERDEARCRYPETTAAIEAEAAEVVKDLQAEQQARAYALTTAPGEHIRPRDLQAATKGAVSFNGACRVLEALEKDGELVRTTNALHAGMLVWMRAQPATPPGRGYALPLSPKEHRLLLNTLDFVLNLSSIDEEDEKVKTGLRAIRGKLKRPA
jgi:hypothetical protein